MALAVLEGIVMEYGYKGRGTVALNTGKNLALRVSPEQEDKRVPKSGDAVRCVLFDSQELGMIVVDWTFE